MKEVSGYSPSKDPRLINCKTGCGNERCFAKRYGLFAEKTCPNFKEPSITTNADRIRGMSDKELARFLPEIRNALLCVLGTDGGCLRPDDPCSDCWLDWLKSPVEKEGEV